MWFTDKIRIILSDGSILIFKKIFFNRLRSLLVTNWGMFRSLNEYFIQKTYSFSEVRKYFQDIELADRRLVGLFLKFLNCSNGFYEFCKIFKTFYLPKNTSNSFKVSVVVSISFTISPLFKTTIRSQTSVT